MLEGVPQRLSTIRELVAVRALLWAVVAGSVALDLTTLRQTQEQRLVTVGGLLLGSPLVYGAIRLLIARGMTSEKVHDVVVQLAGFLVLFLGIVATFALARAVTDRGFAATMAVFHASWALGALDGYRIGTRHLRGQPRALRPIRVAEDASDALARFVYIDDDGSARELGPWDATYLATDFDPGDGGRPYVKDTYDRRTPDGRLRGFLERVSLPMHIAIRPYTPPATTVRGVDEQSP